MRAGDRPAIQNEGVNPDRLDDPTMRADARRNLARVLEAASELFAEEGESVSMEAIAKRAGVGVGTIYRRFPTKVALGEAVIVNHLEQLAREIAEIAETAPARTAFFDALTRILNVASSRRDLKTTLAGVGIDVFAVMRPSYEQIHEVLGGLLQRAQATGEIRPDVTIADVIGLLATACNVTANAEASSRVFSIIADGLRSTPDARLASET
jgi:AcrR family transcriptional regulator